MKRYLIIALLAVGSTIFGVNSLSAQTKQLDMLPLETSVPQTTTVTMTTSSIGSYVFSDYEDLRDQLYDDIYADIYAELYADLSLGNMVSQALYDEIYAAVETKFAELLSEAELDLLVDDTQTKIYEVADLVKNSVVGISSYLDLEGKSLGSGVVYKHDTINDIYYVITNHHVVETGNNFKAVFFDASNVVATLIGYDSDVDIAVLTFSGADIDYDIQVSPLGNSADEMPGTIVLAAGNPQGYDFYGSVTMGVLSGVDRKVDSTVQRYLQHDASINSGNSGGPLYNLDGEVIGINVSKFAATDIEGLGFAIPIDVVKTVVATIESEN